MLVPRVRELVLRDRVALLPEDLAPRPEAAPSPEVAGPLLARADRVLEDFARVAVDLPAVLARDAEARDPAEREPDDAERPRPALPRDDVLDDDEAEPLLVFEPSSVVHLPDITRCAASATASAISEPSLVALVMTLLAA